MQIGLADLACCQVSNSNQLTSSSRKTMALETTADMPSDLRFTVFGAPLINDELSGDSDEDLANDWQDSLACKASDSPSPAYPPQTQVAGYRGHVGQNAHDGEPVPSTDQEA